MLHSTTTAPQNPDTQAGGKYIMIKFQELLQFSECEDCHSQGDIFEKDLLPQREKFEHLADYCRQGIGYRRLKTLHDAAILGADSHPLSNAAKAATMWALVLKQTGEMLGPGDFPNDATRYMGFLAVVHYLQAMLPAVCHFINKAHQEAL